MRGLLLEKPSKIMEYLDIIVKPDSMFNFRKQRAIWLQKSSGQTRKERNYETTSIDANSMH